MSAHKETKRRTIREFDDEIPNIRDARKDRRLCKKRVASDAESLETFVSTNKRTWWYAITHPFS